MLITLYKMTRKIPLFVERSTYSNALFITNKSYTPRKREECKIRVVPSRKGLITFPFVFVCVRWGDKKPSSGEKDNCTACATSTSPGGGGAGGGNTSSVANSTNAAASTGGVNRRTAVLFTRKAKARAKGGQSHRRSPEGEQKKQSDSFRVYR